jgi:hypothetical protein
MYPKELKQIKQTIIYSVMLKTHGIKIDPVVEVQVVNLV